MGRGLWLLVGGCLALLLRQLLSADSTLAEQLVEQRRTAARQHASLMRLEQSQGNAAQSLSASLARVQRDQHSLMVSGDPPPKKQRSSTLLIVGGLCMHNPPQPMRPFVSGSGV